MVKVRFDPFNDRLSRDIRNDLSEKLIEAIASSDLSILSHAVRTWQGQSLQPWHREYIEERNARYNEVFERIEQLSSRTLYYVAQLLWNFQLFFELHEYLESFWMKSSDLEEKKLLQALIRAAGAYIHLQQDRKDSAAKMSSKAVPVLREFKKILDRYCNNTDELIQCLETLNHTPVHLVPRWEGSSLHH